MEIASRIYEALLAHNDPDMDLLDLVRFGKPVNRTGPQVLLREAGRVYREQMAQVFREAYGSQFVRGHMGIHRGVFLDFLGTVQGVPVDLELVSPEEFKQSNQASPPKYLVDLCATKAHLLGADRISVLLVNRDNQAWTSCEILNTRAAALGVLGRLDRSDGRIPSATILPAPSLQKHLDNYFEQLNEKDRGFIRGRISPSHFSTQICDRAVAYGLLATEELESIPPWIRRIFIMGHSFHRVIQLALRDAFPGFLAEIPMRIEEYEIGGSCDGGVQLNIRHGFEIKTISHAEFLKLSAPKAEHQRQATLYGIGLKFDILHYIYVDKATGELKVFSLPPDKAAWHQMATRAALILEKVRRVRQGVGELPPRLQDKDSICKRCVFFHVCKPAPRARTMFIRSKELSV